MKSLFLVVGIFFSAATLFGQPAYEVIETPKVLAKNWQNSYTVNLLGIDDDRVMQGWRGKMQEAGGTLMDNVGDDEATGFRNVSLPAISEEPLNVFCKTYEDSEALSTHLTVWFQTPERFISTRTLPASFRPISRMLLEFSFGLEDQLKASIESGEIQQAKDAFPKTKN